MVHGARALELAGWSNVLGNGEPLLVADQVSFSYLVRRHQVIAVSDVSIAVHPGEVVCLRGESGSGKSTLVALCAGIEVASSGSINVAGQALEQLNQAERDAFRLRHIGVVFQDHNLIAQFTALENVLLVLRCQGNDDPAQARDLLDLVGIGDLHDRRASDMSGGQRQRIGIARALAGQRRLLLCDEPTGSLDHVNSQIIYDQLRSVAQNQSVAVLIASHDPRAAEQADRTVELASGRVVG